jgi:hypothetical protein
LLSGLKISPTKLASIYNGLGLVYKVTRNNKQAKSCYM